MKKSDFVVYLVFVVVYAFFFAVCLTLVKGENSQIVVFATFVQRRVLDFPFGIPLWEGGTTKHIWITLVPNALMMGELFILVRNGIKKGKRGRNVGF